VVCPSVIAKPRKGRLRPEDGSKRHSGRGGYEKCMLPSVTE
jgi:hypothetical protein